MSGKRIMTLLGQLGLTQVRHVSPVRRGAAPDLVRRVYGQVEQEFGVLAPPVALHAPAPRVLAASWLMMRETLIATGQVERPIKEAVATAVSLSNACPFCVTVHNNTLSGLVGSADALARATGPAASATDPRVLAAAAWARDSATEEGALRHEPARPAGEAAELIGTAVLFHYLNRMVNLFLGEFPLPPGVPRIVLGPVMRPLGGMIQRAARQPHPPGTSLDLLPQAELPGDLSWAASNPVVADAFARACAAIERAGAQSVPPVVREAVMAELARWRGEPRGPSRAWVEEAVSGLPTRYRAAGRLALLTALASYQVDRSVIDPFRHDSPDDATLIALTSWASLAAARRVGGWIPADPAETQMPEMPQTPDTPTADAGSVRQPHSRARTHPD
ncbi:MAG TPA: carboxymuconolactone decarboxylase family protein [Streptosporangiaceae bacterium]